MTKKMISWLACMAVFLIISSCRNDMFPEKETFQNSSSFQLTSKRISLYESKHRQRLAPEVSKAETFLKSLKTNLSGKTVSYGNGVSIDTDDVIYIENGPNYHTYTFHIKRENAPENAPLENLVLSPLSDGSYRELLVTYELTPQEKQQMQSGWQVDLTSKVFTQELASGTYVNGILNKSTTTQCHWETYTYTTPCACHPGHTNINSCDCPKGKPVQYVLTWNVCEEVDDPAPTGGNNDTGNNGGGDPVTGNNPNNPCGGSGASTQPQEAGSSLGTQEGCNNGIPTLPNLDGNPNNPCAKTKNMLQKPKMQQAISAVTDQAKKAALDVNEGEIGRIEKNGDFYPADVSEDHHVTFNNINGATGIYHNHTNKGAKIHSPPDIYFVLDLAKEQNVSAYGDVYVGMIGAAKCFPVVAGCYRIFHYLIRFSGTTADLSKSFTEDEMKELKKYVVKQESEYREQLPYVDFLGDVTLNKKGYEKLFFETLAKMGLSGKVILQRVDDDGKIYNINLDANGIPEAVPCS